MVAGGCAAAAAILGYHVLQRSRGARIALTVLAVPLFVSGLVTGGLPVVGGRRRRGDAVVPAGPRLVRRGDPRARAPSPAPRPTAAVPDRRTPSGRPPARPPAAPGSGGRRRARAPHAAAGPRRTRLRHAARAGPAPRRLAARAAAAGSGRAARPVRRRLRPAC